tara:strand:- start:107 stop:661 length:555 start_codon:yes stop_codon:yes gene_type:complete
MDLFGTIGEWIDTGVDWVAEAVGYEDIDDIDFGFTAGEQLVSDVKSFTDSDTFGFIKKGADYYAKSAGLLDKDGKAKTNYFQPPESKRRSQARPVGALTSGSGAMTRAGFTPTKVNTGYNNPDVRSALTSLLNNSYNQQMNNMFASYLVSPTKTSGQRTIGIGTTSVKGVAKKAKTARKSRGLA